MANVEIKCSECYTKLSVPEDVLGTKIKCPKCKEVFFAEAGDSYGIVEEPKPRPVRAAEPEEASGPSRGGASRKPAKPEKPKKESKAERAQREMMEKWSKKME